MKKHITNNDLIDQAYNEAILIVRNCSHPVGMKASGLTKGYPQVWARDSMITLLGASLINDSKVTRSLKASFNILKKKQSSLGSIPNNVDVKSLKPNFQAYADSGLWFVIGNAFFFKQTNDKKFLRSNYTAIKKL